MRESKTTLTEKVVNSTNRPRVICEESINKFVELMIENIIQGNEVEIRGLGIFSIIRIKERLRVNPRTKEQFLQPAKAQVKFKVAKRIKEAINDN